MRLFHRSSRAGQIRPLLGVIFVAGAALAVGAEPTPETWNPGDKESPEPYGYDVETAPDLPLGTIDPADPPATLEIGPDRERLAGTLDVATTIDRTAYSWFGSIIVNAAVTAGGQPVTACDSVAVVSAANPRVRAYLADDGVAPDEAAGDGVYSGVFEIGAGEGEARPTGNYSLTATAYRSADTGSDASATFSLYSVRRWTGITTSNLPDIADEYTAFVAIPNGPGAGYHHTIRDLGLIRSSSVSDAQIRIPILPRANGISGLSVTGNGVSNVVLRDNVIGFDCNLTGATVARVDIEFDAPSDLAATLIDRYHTGDIGLRNFRNGYLVWNRYLHTGIMGSGFSSPHGPGCLVDLHATDLATGDAHTVDCMERVAVHLDDRANNDGSGTYQSNIKWGGDALSWLETADLGSFVFRFVSGGNYGLQDDVEVERHVEFFAESRYFRHHYRIRNTDQVSHDFDFVWGREQWLYGTASGSNRQNRDRGLLPNDATSYGGEFGFAPSQIDGNWFAAFDEGSFYSIAVLFPDPGAAAMPSFAYLLCDPALGNFTGEYPVNPSGVCTDMPNLFFEKQLGVLAPNETADYEFYQWGGYGSTRQELTQILGDDADAIAVDPSSADNGSGSAVGLALRSISPNPASHSIEVRFDLPRTAAVRLALYDVRGRFLISLVDDMLPAGPHLVTWAMANDRTGQLPNGVYLLRLDALGRQEARKVVLRR